MAADSTVSGPVIPDWKQQFHEVKIIGPEPDLNREGFWKKPDPPMVKFMDKKDAKYESDR